VSAMPQAVTLYDWLLFGHVVAAMVWVGGIAVLNVLAAQILRSGEPDAVSRVTGSLRVIGPVVLAPSVVALLAFGIWLVVDSEAWDFGQGWVRLGLALFAGAFVVGAVFQSRSAIAAQRAAAAGDAGEAARQLSRWAWGMRLILVLLLVATWDMVAKPGL
jgi:uncharacterized membrane protein